MINASYKTLKSGPFAQLLSLAEAAEIWGLEESTIRKAIAANRLYEGVDCRKFGKQWVITAAAMRRVFAPYSQTWPEFLHDLKKEDTK